MPIKKKYNWLVITNSAHFGDAIVGNIKPHKCYHVFFYLIAVEHQKLIKTTAELPFGCVFVVNLGLRQTQALISTNCITSSSSLLDDGEVIGSTNECLCLPKAELSTKNSTKR